MSFVAVNGSYHTLHSLYCVLTHPLFNNTHVVFDGTIPNMIGDMESLKIFTASNNSRRTSKGLSGILPDSIGRLAKLKTFDVSDNSLTGQIPASLGQCTKLEVLYLHQNSLEGDVPPELGNLESITEMKLGDNNLAGEVPEGLCSAGTGLIQVDCSVTCTEGCCTEYDCDSTF